MILIIGGLDPTAKAGILADSSVLEQMKLEYRCCMTVNTIQSVSSLVRINATDESFFEDQLRTLMQTTKFHAVKIGFLANLQLAKALGRVLEDYHPSNIVIDPVIFGKRVKQQLVKNDLIEYYKSCLFPKATIITPNLTEACGLLGIKPVQEHIEVETLAWKLAKQCHTNVIVSCRKLQGNSSDYLIERDKGQGEWLHFPHYEAAQNAIGLGCRYSTSISAYLGMQNTLHASVLKAKEDIDNWIRNFSYNST